MHLSIDQSEIRDIVNAVVTETIQTLGADYSQFGEARLAYLESEAASLLGVKASVLRDARIRGEITSTKIGGRIGYETSELRAYLSRNRQEK